MRILQEKSKETYFGPLRPVINNDNIIADSSFENGITGWSGVSSTLTSESTVKKTGSKSLKMTVSASTGSANYTESSVLAGSRKVMKAWVRGDATSAGRFVRLKITASDSSFQDTVAVKLDQNKWEEIWCTYRIPVDGNVTYSVISSDMANGEICYIDDVTVQTYNLPVVQAIDRKIHYNGQPTYLRACNYNNTPTEGQSNANFATQEKILRYDMVDLKDQGCNSIRIYDDAYNRNDYGRGLDVCYQHGIGVQAWRFLWLSGDNFVNGDPYGEISRASAVGRFVSMVTQLKDHPAIIGYFFGSETNYHVSGNSSASLAKNAFNNTQTDWYSLIDEACQAGKLVDNTRIYSTSNGGVNSDLTDSLVPNMDVWGYTIYRGGVSNVHRGSSVNGIREEIMTKTAKPAILTEVGVGAYAAGWANGHQRAQSDSDLSLYRQLERYSDVIAGYTYFQYSDDRGDTSWYGKSETVSSGTASNRTKREAFFDIKRFWRSESVY